MKYDVKSVSINEYKTGARAGQRKPVELPKDAIPCGVVSGYGLKLYYLVPAGKS